MGEVYLAQDTTLDRKVALKILPLGLASNQDRMRRFAQEAKAASALNHPHIVTIYEIGTSGDSPFIVTEFIDGETLRQQIGAGLKLTDILEIVIQACSALSAAHAAGIIHRDIKPENIMVRRDGFVKLLDFGLAKLAGVGPDIRVETRTMFATDPGLVVGTAVYMSPEQARGLDVDARTDIFSLGDVLYEMVAGRRPFDGSTSNEVMASILSETEPQPLARYSRDTPAELERIVSKALRKNRDERYQTIKDMLLDLKSLKQELEFEKKLERADSGTRLPSAARAAGGERGPASLLELNPRRIVFAVAALLLIAAAGAYLYFTRARSGPINSVAVLPFVNGSGNGDVEYLSDGLTESLITSLSQLPRLSVKARSSVFRYKGKDAQPKQVGRELGVQAIVNGRVVQRGDDLTLHIELVDADSETALWSADYKRTMANIVSLPAEIAHDVSSKLRLTLSGSDEQKLAKNYTRNTDAYQAYLRGRFYTAASTESGLKKSIEYFNQAIAIDPDYALAWAGLAEAYWGDSDIHAAPRDVMPKAKQAAMKAIAIDDTLAEAHSALAIELAAYDWDWPQAEHEFKRAIALNPQYATAHAHYGWYLSLMGRTEAAIAESQRAVELDPLSTEYNHNLGLTFFRGRRLDQAVAQFRKTAELDPGDWITRTNIGWVLISQGKLTEAFTELHAARQMDDNHYVLAALGRAHALSGNRSDALEAIAQMKEWSHDRYVSPHSVALVYAGLGENDQAFEWLEKALVVRSEHLGWLKVDPRMDPLRADPRFDAIVRRVGL
jgi:serine/threonine protein kinase/Tfp pilus assembly protein PilF